MSMRSSARRWLLAALLCSGPVRLSALELFADNTPDDLAQNNFFSGTGSGNTGNLRYCINLANQNPGSTINITNSSTRNLIRMLPPITAPVTIKPPLFVHLDGGNLCRAFFIDVPNGGVVRLQGLKFINLRGSGGDGGPSAGGGAALGAAIILNSGHLILDNCEFVSGSLVGGKGGNGSSSAGGGGGGGLNATAAGGGNYGGGGGLLGPGGSNVAGFNYAGGGGGGIVGIGGNGTSGGPGTGGGGGGGTTNASGMTPGSGGGTGQVTGSSSHGGAGALYGGGGGAANGSLPNGAIVYGGSGGRFGGGGGAGSGTSSGGSGGDFAGGGGGQNYGGNGGLGGGGGGAQASGGVGGLGGFGGGNGSRGAHGGHGGSAYGGFIFVNNTTGHPTQVELFNTNVVAATATAGAGGTPVAGSGGSTGVAGQVAGTSIYYLLGSFASGTLNYSVQDFDQTIAGSIGSEAGSALGLNFSKSGNARLTLGSPNTFRGNVHIAEGTLRLAAGANLGPPTNRLYVAATFDLNGNPLRSNGIDGAGSGLITNLSSTPLTISVESVSVASSYDGRIEDGGSQVSLVKLGSYRQTLNNLNTYTGGTTVTEGELALHALGGDGSGTIVGALTIDPGGVVLTGARHALGYHPTRRVQSMLVDGGLFNHFGPGDIGWSLAYTLKNGRIFSNAGNSSLTTDSKFAFSVGTTVRVTGGGSSEIRGRIDLRPPGFTRQDFLVESGSDLHVHASITSAEGAIGIRKTGSGNMNLYSPSNFTGDTVVSSGVLNLGLPGGPTPPTGIGLLIGGITVDAGALLTTSVPEAFGYNVGSRVGGVVLNNSTFRNNAEGPLGWSVDYTLNGGLMISNDGVRSTTANSAFTFGGDPGLPTFVRAIANTSNEIRGRITLRGDGAPNSTVLVESGATLHLSAGLSSLGGPVVFTKTGPGTLRITGGANTYVGETVLADGVTEFDHAASFGPGNLRFTGGTLRWVGLNADLSGQVNFAGSTATYLLDTNGQNVNFTGLVTGSSGLTKLGAGTLTLANNNAYSGVTNLHGGTLSVAATSALGSSRVTFNGGILRYGGSVNADFSAFFNFTGSGALRIDTNNRDVVFATPLGGTTGLEKLGLGILSLPAGCTYSGITRLSGGLLALAAPTALGTSSVFFAGGGLRYVGFDTDLSNRFEAGATGAILIDTNGQNVTFGSALSGSGGLAKEGPGTLTLGAANPGLSGPVLIGGGPLQVGNNTPGSLGSGIAPVSFNANGTGSLIFRQTNNVTQSGAIGGPGALTVHGPGTVELGGENTYTGATTIHGGALRLGGAAGLYARGISGSITINGGTLVFAGTEVLGADATAPATTLSARAGSLIENTATFNVINQLTLEGATLRANGGASAAFPSYRFRGTVAVTGMTPSTIAATTSSNAFNSIVLSDTTVFDVADVTASPAVDLTIAPAFQNGSTGPAGVLRKRGAGTMRLNGVSTYSGPTVIEAGTLALGPGATLGTAVGSVTIASGASLDVSALGTAGFALASGRTLTNDGAIEGVLVLTAGSTYLGNGEIHGGLTVNSGVTLARTSGSLKVTGTVVNHGILRFTAGALFDASGVTSFANHGVVDLISAAPASALPNDIVNGASGIVLTPSNVKVKSASKAGSVVTIQIDGFTAHTYQLQRSNDLASGGFTNVGAPQPGTGATAPVVLTFTDDAASSAEAFYRVVVQ